MNQDVINIISITGSAFSVIGTFFAFLAWRKSRCIEKYLQKEQERKNKKVTIILTHGSQKKKLPVQIRRGDLKRNEILGRLGMIPKKEKGKQDRFFLPYLSSLEFQQQIDQITDGVKDNILTISCTKEEFEHFDSDSF